ncbi:metallophosphoesterase family protein [Roseimaritima ulvae]|uniref:Calcineurin-like phosphoesterase n=1 Tax=Roseimaritima ulvae TaxID=980254 RepID=A0A5B9QPN0_9BACT|nr:metallophosphoesterase [Roseimaritima ulvae]QEG39879.1 Calcineurin-like phosphoesterase [Roseimaritima ulvae]
MINRRRFIGSIPVAAVALSTLRPQADAQAAEAESQDASPDDLIRSPPVVQNPRADSFGVSIAVGGLSTAWIEYGFTVDQLTHTAVASHHGLISADDRVLHVRVQHPDPLPSDRPIFYRVVVQPLSYKNAYSLTRGEPQATDTYALRLPNPTTDRVRIVSINDTHENLETILALHTEIEKLDPDLLIWNGDSCNDFDDSDSPEQILLNPAKDLTKSWAGTRPLVFSNGNHDVRGSRAREVIKSFVGCPESTELPYNQALRCGPVALLTLDTGEDKPDHHPVFAGTASYQPYRQRQARWLQETIQRPEVQDAPFNIAACHIPLRGLPGHNDGTTLDGYAYYSGFGAKLWLPLLQQANCRAILSGHMHRDRLDPATPEMPIPQFVGGGPAPASATLTIIDAEQTAAKQSMDIRIVDLKGNVLHQQQWSPA